MCNTTNTCICLPPWESDDYPMPFPINPIMMTPLDKLGFAFKCCHCIPLRIGCIFICIISFLWATLEMSSATKTMGKIFDDEEELYWAKLLYSLFAFAMIVASGLLMLGLILTHYKLLNYYVWHALIFNCVCIAVYMATVVKEVLKTGNITARKTFKMMAYLTWNFLFFYFIMVVNSYKIMIWE